MTDGPRRRPRPTGSTSSSARRAPAKKAPATARKKPPASASASARKPSSTSARKPASTSGRKPASTSGRKRAPAKAAPRPGRRIAAGLVVSVVLVGFLLIGVFPTRTWLAQREETRERQEELDRIRAEQAVHEERIEELEDPDEIEAIARGEHNYIRPGETAYQILPAPVPPVELPDTWPFVGADDWLNR